MINLFFLVSFCLFPWFIMIKIINSFKSYCSFQHLVSAYRQNTRIFLTLNFWRQKLRAFFIFIWNGGFCRIIMFMKFGQFCFWQVIDKFAWNRLITYKFNCLGLYHTKKVVSKNIFNYIFHSSFHSFLVFKCKVIKNWIVRSKAFYVNTEHLQYVLFVKKLSILHNVVHVSCIS